MATAQEEAKDLLSRYAWAPGDLVVALDDASPEGLREALRVLKTDWPNDSLGIEMLEGELARRGLQ